jgi:Beta-glucosidase-related glycosidases
MRKLPLFLAQTSGTRPAFLDCKFHRYGFQMDLMVFEEPNCSMAFQQRASHVVCMQLIVSGFIFWGCGVTFWSLGTAIGATWDVKLAREAGELQGKEAIVKGVAVILGPTVNMQRSPLGGRGFESFSEDPILSGKLGAGIVNGIQSTGVSAAIKHFVCNDQEDQRQLVDSIVTERALREIYLLPFQIVQRDAIPKCYMTAYNRLNGVHCSENPALIQGILREEWGFDGLVLSDW